MEAEDRLRSAQELDPSDWQAVADLAELYGQQHYEGANDTQGKALEILRKSASLVDQDISKRAKDVKNVKGGSRFQQRGF